MVYDGVSGISTVQKAQWKTKLKTAATTAKSAALPKIPRELIDQIVIKMRGHFAGDAMRPPN
jgi:hypothetical protein